MMNQVTDCDRLAVRGQLRQVLVDVIIQAERAFLREQGNGHRCELLGERANIESRGWRYGDLVLQIGHAVAARMDDLSISDNRQGAAGRVRVIPWLEQLVHSSAERRIFQDGPAPDCRNEGKDEQ